MTQIRLATTREARAACNVIRRSIMHCCSDDYRNDSAILDRWLSSTTPDIVEGWFSWPTHFPLVAMLDDQVAGVAMLSGRRKIVLMHVDPQWRLAGIGTALLQTLEVKAAKSGAPYLKLSSTFSARLFYERHGYSVTGTTDTVVYGTALTMIKSLSARP